MEIDERTAADKRETIRRAAASAKLIYPALLNKDIETSIDAFSSVTAPGESEVRFGAIVISSLYSAPSAHSRKPGNIILNWRKLIDIVPDVSLAGLGATGLPIAPAWSTLLVGLYVWNKIWKNSIEDFSDAEAVTILALWKNRNGQNMITEEDAFKKTNELQANYSLPALTQGQFTAIVDRFLRMDCIELVNGNIWLRESVSIKYV